MRKHVFGNIGNRPRGTTRVRTSLKVPIIIGCCRLNGSESLYLLYRPPRPKADSPSWHKGCMKVKKRSMGMTETILTISSKNYSSWSLRGAALDPVRQYQLAVARILGDGMRQRTRIFSELQSHYVVADRFGRPGKGNDKGKVEGLIGWIRWNLLVPVPRAASLATLNEQ